MLGDQVSLLAIIPVEKDGGLHQGGGHGAGEKWASQHHGRICRRVGREVLRERDQSRLMTKLFSRRITCMELTFVGMGRLGKEQD